METLLPKAGPAQDGGSGTIQRRDQWILLLIVLLGAAIRLYHLNAQSVWYDEAFSVAHSVRPVKELLNELVEDLGHPPLHYLVLHGWFRIAGFGAMQARLTAAIFGTVSIPLLFLLARRFTDPATSLVAAFLLAVSQMGVYFSQEVRPYAQAQFLSLLAALAFLSFLKNPRFRSSLSFAMAGMALLYTHYYCAGTLLALGLYWLIFRRDYSPLVFRRLAAIVVLLVLAYVPWIVALQLSGRLSRTNLTVNAKASPNLRPNLSSPLAALNRFNNGKFESIEEPSTLAQSLLGLAIFTLPAALALRYTWRSGPHGVVLGWLLAAIPVGMAIVFGVFGSIYNYRHYSFAVPGYYLAVAIGWRVWFRSTAARAAWLAMATVLSVFALRANLVVTKPDYREGFRPLAQSYRPGDCVASGPVHWYNAVHLDWEVYYPERKLRLVPFGSLATAATTCDRLWLVWDRTWWMDRNQVEFRKSRQAIAGLSDHYDVVERYRHPAIELQLLQRRSQ